MKTDLEKILELYESDYIHAIARDLVNPQDVEDVVQDVALRAIRALQDYEQNRITVQYPKAWLRTITKNVCVNHIIKKAGQSICLSLETAEESGWQMTTNLDDVARTIVQQELNKSVNRLLRHEVSAKNARIISQHFLQGLKHTEIAQHMHKPAHAIRSRFSRSLSHLQRRLKQGAFDIEDLR